MNNQKPPFARLFLDNKRYWPGLFIMVLLALLAGVFKTRAATLWGEAVDFGVKGYIDPMLFSALGMLLFAIIAVFVFIVFKTSKWVHYADS